jgi:hypothetical protein
MIQVVPRMTTMPKSGFEKQLILLTSPAATLPFVEAERILSASALGMKTLDLASRLIQNDKHSGAGYAM